MANPIFKLIRQFLCSHKYEEVWHTVIKYQDGAELGYTTEFCTKCGKVE